MVSDADVPALLRLFTAGIKSPNVALPEVDDSVPWSPLLFSELPLLLVPFDVLLLVLWLLLETT